VRGLQAVNGNKRTAFVAMVVFVELNGWAFDDAVTDDAIVDVVVSVAAHRFPSTERGRDADAVVAALAAWIEASIVPSRSQGRKSSEVIDAVLRRFARVLRQLADANGANDAPAPVPPPYGRALPEA
jgi:hypothetical protein